MPIYTYIHTYLLWDTVWRQRPNIHQGVTCQRVFTYQRMCTSHSHACVCVCLYAFMCMCAQPCVCCVCMGSGTHPFTCKCENSCTQCDVFEPRLFVCTDLYHGCMSTCPFVFSCACVRCTCVCACVAKLPDPHAICFIGGHDHETNQSGNCPSHNRVIAKVHEL